MATTISTSQTYDSAARTAGDTYTINSGAVFTIDSDTRDGKNAPAARAGSTSSFTMTAATGGKVVLDGSKVKYINYDGLQGTPNVPALGTTIAGVTSGATGELMNISASIATIPTAAGSAMPATGIIKFKSTTGTFQDNEIIEIQGSTDLCTANGTLRTGWIEVVMDDAATITIGRAQEFVINNDNVTYWFESETTGSGSAQQQVQFPNYGGANFFLAGCWVDEAANGTWEFWPAGLAGTGSFWTTANQQTLDKNKFCQCLAGGILRFGGDGSNAIGKVPTYGAKFRIPNVLLKSAATGSRASDSVPHATTTSRPDFVMTSAGSLRLNGAIGHWNIVSSQAYAITLRNVALLDVVNISETATALTLDNVHNGSYNLATDAASFLLANNYAGGTVSNCKFGRVASPAASDYGTSVTYCNNITFSGCHFQGRVLRGNAATYTSYFGYCDGLIFNDCVTVGSGMYIFTCTNTILNDTLYADLYSGISSATNAPVGALVLTNSNGIVVDGFGWYTSTANQHPDTCIVYCSFSQNIKVRNIGTFASPLTAGSSNAMLYVCDDAGNSYNLQFKRIYMNLVATTLYRSVNSTKKVLIENCSSNTSAYKALVAGALDMDVKNTAVLSTGNGIVPASLASIYGSIFAHLFTSSSAGRLQLIFNEPSAAYASYVTTSFTTTSTGTSGFNSGGGLALINNTDYAIFEFPYLIVGIDSFQNAAPTVTTATHITSEYQINTGSGWSAWKTLDQTNIYGETVDEVAGFYFKLRFTCNSTDAANLLALVTILTSSNSTAQAIEYPLDTCSVSATNLVTGSRIVAKKVSDGTVLANMAETSGTATFSTDYFGSVSIEARKASASPFYIPWTTQVTTTASGTVSAVALQVRDDQ